MNAEPLCCICETMIRLYINDTLVKKKIPIKKLCIKDSTNNIIISEHENGRANTSPFPLIGFLMQARL